MKFKKEDIGLYFALGLVGGGAGLLAGVFVASRLAPPRPIYIPEPDYDAVDEVRNKYELPSVKTVLKKARVEKSEKKELSEEMEEFIDQYQPSAIQIEMIKNELLTIEEVKDALVKEELSKRQKPYNYNTVYHTEEDKPDLEELARLPDEIDIIDERWQISSKQTEAKSGKNLRRIYYDLVDEDFFVMSRQGSAVPLGPINKIIPTEAWEAIEPYLVSGMGPIFVNDLETVKHFKFEVVSEETEDTSVDDASNQ